MDFFLSILPYIILAIFPLYILLICIQGGILQATMHFFKVPHPKWKISIGIILMGMIVSILFTILIQSLVFLLGNTVSTENSTNLSNVGQLGSLIIGTWMTSYYYNLSKGKAFLIILSSIAIQAILFVIFFIALFILLIMLAGIFGFMGALK